MTTTKPEANRAAVVWEPYPSSPPDVVVEVASHSTCRNDNVGKREIYRQIGVPEYRRFDPTGGAFYGQPIIGERLVNHQYEPLPLGARRFACARTRTTRPIDVGPAGEPSECI